MLAPLICMLMLAHGPIGSAPGPANPLAMAALDAFATKCAQCHGTDLPHPRGAFGYVTDLRRLVASQKYVLPGNLDKSELWKEIDEGDMPPDEARAGPLTPQETDAIRRWILAGAPPLLAAEPALREPSPPVAEPPSVVAPPPLPAPGPQPEPVPLLDRLVALTGRLHVLVVHFPIALLLAAALGEAWGALRRSGAVAPSVRFCLSLGAIAALVAAELGWVRALDGFVGPLSSPTSLTGLHRWLGTSVGVLAPLVALLSEREARRGARSPLVRAAIFVLALLVGVAGHFGGLLTHGPEFFDL